MEKIIRSVVNALKDKNAGYDTIRTYVRIALELSEFEFSDSEKGYIIGEVGRRLPFDPLKEVF